MEAFIAQYYPSVLSFYKSNACSLMAQSLAGLTDYLYVTVIVIINTVAIGISTTLQVALHRAKEKMSERTFKMHKSLLFSLSLQSLVPIVMIGLPYAAKLTALAMGLPSNTNLWPANVELDSIE